MNSQVGKTFNVCVEAACLPRGAHPADEHREPIPVVPAEMP
jgi:hypothetical protein